MTLTLPFLVSVSPIGLPIGETDRFPVPGW
jgi:hypothetical protein